MKKMKRIKSSIFDLNNDVLQYVMVRLGKSEDGYADIARVTSVCKDFKELVGKKEVLRTVVFEESYYHKRDDTYWNVDGILTKCARAGSETACEVLSERLEEQLLFSNMMIGFFNNRVKNFHAKISALKGVHTRARSKAAALAWEKVRRMGHEICMISSLIYQQREAVEVGWKEHKKARRSNSSLLIPERLFR